MRKILTRVLALICMITMFTAPTSAFAASVAVCTYNQDNLKIFTLQPGPFVMNTGDSFMCMDTTASYGYFTVPANESSTFRCKFSSPCQYKLTVIQVGAGYVDTVNGTTALKYIGFPVSDMERQYVVLITATSPCYLVDYYFHYY